MFTIDNEGFIKINQGDTFSIMCCLDREIIEQEQIVLNIKTPYKTIEKSITKQENLYYFIFQSEDTKNIAPGLYDYSIKYKNDNVLYCLMQNKIEIKEG